MTGSNREGIPDWVVRVRQSTLLDLSVRLPFWALAGIPVLFGGCGFLRPEPPLRQDWNLSQNFDMSELDTGNIVETCFVDAPWGSQSWGVEASSFLDTNNNQLDAARFRAYGNRAYLYGRETAGSWGFARFVQGDIWGGSNCDQPIRWHVPEPLPVADWQLYIDMRALRVSARVSGGKST